MRESKVIILTSLQSFNYHFRCYSMLLLQLYLSFHLGSLHRHSDSPHFLYFHPDSPHSTAILHTRIPIPFLVFPPLLSTFPPFRSPMPHFGFYRYHAQFVFFKNLFQENSCFSSKTNTPLFYYSIILGTKNYQKSPKIIYLIVRQVKNL